jgi:hypothetical protein
MDDDTGSGSSSRPSLVRAQAALSRMRVAPSIKHLGTRLTRAEREQAERECDRAAGIAEE